MNEPPRQKSAAERENNLAARPLLDLDDLAKLFDLHDSEADGSPAEKPSAAGEKYVVFSLDEKSYAVRARQVSEVSSAPAVAPLPDAPAWLAGIANLRGEITAVVDLRRLWRSDSAAPARMKAIGLKSEKTDARAAFLVDKVNEIVTLAPPDIKFSAADFEASLPAVFGRTTKGGRAIFLLDADHLLASLVFENRAAL